MNDRIRFHPDPFGSVGGAGKSNPDRNAHKIGEPPGFPNKPAADRREQSASGAGGAGAGDDEVSQHHLPDGIDITNPDDIGDTWHRAGGAPGA